MSKCQENRGKGHTWKGHGPDRICEKCGLMPEHASETFPGGAEKWRKENLIPDGPFKGRLKYNPAPKATYSQFNRPKAG